jgi:hypothetical protein
MGTLINIMICIALAAVLVSLGLGIYSLLRGGDYALKNSNKFMQWRVKTQFVAIVLITIGFAYKMTHG